MIEQPDIQLVRVIRLLTVYLNATTSATGFLSLVVTAVVMATMVVPMVVHLLQPQKPLTLQLWSASWAADAGLGGH